jgi:hypothetical protein
MRILAVALVAFLGSGCFAFEEIEAGEKLMDKHYAGSRKEPPRRQAEEPAPDAGPVDRLRHRAERTADQLRHWWAKLSLPGAESSEDDDQLVRCTVEGRTHYARMADCRARGGSAVPVDPPKES